MATIGQWIEGARPRTFPNAIAPVLAGAGAAAYLDGFSWLHSALALVVALALIVGVNYANDYSDGVRGTDDDRVGPLRLVGSRTAQPKEVRAAALSSFLFAGIAGLTLIIISGHWWLLAVGAACLAGAWFYTGGRRPYGYAGFGEVAVFLFFGLIAVLGTVYIQADTIGWLPLGCAVAIGSFSAAVLLTNNLRDIGTDTEAGKRTLAVRLGDTGTRRLYFALLSVPFLVTILLGIAFPPALFGVLAAPAAISPARIVARRATGRALIPVLRDTGLVMLLWAAITAIVLATS
ncbi:MAG: 1,4-dihydroxy-2-naphthoate polyprenyltransferase [Actinophytocola sp.]|nr:1,4-dihydroxy-2-naphthoate polyprenyltransferase [Actinophytocola sp.]